MPKGARTNKLLSRTLSIFFLKKGFMSGFKPNMKPFFNTSIKTHDIQKAFGRLDFHRLILLLSGETRRDPLLF